MKTTTFFNMLAASLLILSVAACENQNSTDSKDIAEDINEQRFEDTYLENDAEFAVDAAGGDLTRIEMAQLAVNSSGTEAVRQLAQDILNDHGTMHEELKSFAVPKKIALPTTPDEDDQKKINNLSEKRGTDFDKAYLDYTVTYHKEAISLFEKEAEKGRDAQLKQWAAEKLPVMQEHLNSAELVKKAINKR